MKYLIRWVMLSVAGVMVGPAWADEPQADHYDVVVYGGTSSGVIAATQAGRMGKQVVLIALDGHIGGMAAGGLGATDRGNVRTVGGITREFYQAVYRHYQDPGGLASGDPGRVFAQAPLDHHRASLKTHWFLAEPHVADMVFRDLLKKAGVTMVSAQRLDRKSGVKEGRDADHRHRHGGGAEFRGQGVCGCNL